MLTPPLLVTFSRVTEIGRHLVSIDTMTPFKTSDNEFWLYTLTMCFLLDTFTEFPTLFLIRIDLNLVESDISTSGVPLH